MIEIEIKENPPELFDKLEAAVSRFVKATADEIAEKARSLMRGPKSGRIYRGHRASAPGEAPASFSGRYMAGIAVVTENALETKVGASVPYAPLLEYGLDRPMWGPVLKEILPTLDTRLAAEISGI